MEQFDFYQSSSQQNSVPVLSSDEHRHLIQCHIMEQKIACALRAGGAEAQTSIHFTSRLRYAKEFTARAAGTILMMFPSWETLIKNPHVGGSSSPPAIVHLPELSCQILDDRIDRCRTRKSAGTEGGSSEILRFAQNDMYEIV
jgi:hypothetical protein